MALNNAGPIRVVVVDDSPSVRELLVQLLNAADEINVVSAGGSGEDAVRLVKSQRPDVLVMDVRMPQIDGLEATRRIMRENPVPIVLISADMNRPNLSLAFEAIRAGALTVIGKPSMDDEVSCEKVVQTVRTMARVPVIHHWREASSKASAGPLPRPLRGPALAPPRLTPRELDVIGIASSTGGPSALSVILKRLTPAFPLPILVVQHVSNGFTAGLVEWLNTQAGLPVQVAANGERLLPGCVMVAPEDYHLQVGRRGEVQLLKSPPYRSLRPSANFLFHSLASVYGRSALGIILTGMGDDGVDGLAALHHAGAVTVAQDEQSCVVYGMPGEAVARKAASHVLDLDQIAGMLEDLETGAPPVEQASPFPASER
ncbi:MAG: chemotaxis-specific protein-glutamate methyltransferase CheB [Chloroflexota bacterium]